MANDFYNPTGIPANNAPGLSPPVRNEFILVRNMAEKLPSLSGHAREPVFVNDEGTALVSLTAEDARDFMQVQPTTDPTFEGEVRAPTPAQYDHSNLVANTTFVNRAGLHFQPIAGIGISGPTSLTATQGGCWFEVTNNAPVTLPNLGTTKEGLTTYTFRAVTGFTLSTPDGKAISSLSGSGTSMAADAGSFVTVVSNGPTSGGWYVAMTGYGPAAMALKANLASPVLTGNPIAPTQTRLSDNTRIATMEAILNHGMSLSKAGLIGIAGSTGLSAAHANKGYEIQSAGVTVTLPDAGTVPVGSIYLFKAVFNFTLATTGGQNILSDALAATSYGVLKGQFAMIVSNGTAWYLMMAGFGADSYKKSITSGTGYIRNPNGIMEVFGNYVCPGSAWQEQSITFPQAFLTEVYNIQMTPRYTGTGSMDYGFSSETKTGFKSYSSVGSIVMHYRAIGDW